MLPHNVTEANFQQALVELAHRLGWRVQHSRTIRTHNGRWMTPISGHIGFPDLVLAHPRRGVIFAELKTARGRLAPDQLAWREALEPHIEYHLWRPADWDAIILRLQKDPAT